MPNLSCEMFISILFDPISHIVEVVENMGTFIKPHKVKKIIAKVPFPLVHESKLSQTNTSSRISYKHHEP